MRMSRSDRRAVWGAMALLWTLPVAAYLSTTAKADGPTVEQYAFANASGVCALLDQDPNVNGVSNIVEQLSGDGFTLDQIADVVTLSVQNVCPTYVALFAELAEEYQPKVPITAGVGGALR